MNSIKKGGALAAETHVLRITCPDEKGLVHKVTGVLYKKGLNIESNDEFVDREKKLFFMRTEFSGQANLKMISAQLKKLLPSGAEVRLEKDRKKNIVIFATKEPHCLGDLLIRNAFGELHANVLAVISNHDVLKNLAHSFKIPYYSVSCDGKTKLEHEAAILKLLSRLKPEYVVLAKYMQVLTSDFVSKYENRIVNIHHSFLPAFSGAHPYQQAAERGVKIIGATAHLVTSDLDQGPIISQGIVPVDHSHSVTDMSQAGRDVEKIVLAKALSLVFEDRIFVSGNKTIIFD